MPAKKPKQLNTPVGEDYIIYDESDSDITIGDIDLDFSNSTADTIDVSGIGTITLDPSVYSVNGSMAGSSITWTQDYSTTVGYGWDNGSSVKIDTNGINVKEGGDIKVGGKSLTEAIEKIEERLGILHPNPELEDKWEQLKELRRQYQELEKDLLEKEKMWKILKEK